MAEAKKKYPALKFTTPRGPLIFPSIHKPNTKWKAEGEYNAKIRLASDAKGFLVGKETLDRKALEERLETLRDEYVKTVREGIESGEIGVKWNKKERAEKLKTLKLRPVFVEETDDEGEEVGTFTINAKMLASGVSKKTEKAWTRKPDVFDAAGKRLTVVPAAFGGTEAKVSAEAGPYYTPKDNEVGIRIKLMGVQLIKLVKAGEMDASGHGFAAEDDGYQEEAEEASEGGDAKAEDGDDGDF